MPSLRERAENEWNKFALSVRLPAMPRLRKPQFPGETEGTCLEMPLVRQLDFFSCGVVAGWSVIRSIYPDQGRENYIKFYGDCRASVERGTSTTALVKALRANGIGVSVRRRRLGFDELVREIELGYPLIACV